MNDLIIRQAAIDAVEEVGWYHQNQHGEMVSGANSAEHQAWYKAEDIYTALERVPSAEPEPCDFCIYNMDCGDMRLYCPARGRKE